MGKNSLAQKVCVFARERYTGERDTHTKTQGSNRSGRKFPLGKEEHETNTEI